MDDKSEGKHSAQRVRYCICVQGELDDSWSGWLNGMSVTVENEPGKPPLTTLTGSVEDQAALRGILNRIWDVNLILVSLEQIPPEVEDV